MDTWKLAVVLLISYQLYLVNCDEDESMNHHYFNVQPGGEVHLLSRYLGPFECSFTYAAQGGTNEQWFFDLEADHDGKLYTCSIGRPSGSSYLVFSQFKVELYGAELKDAEIFSSQRDKLSEDEYTLDKEQNLVSSNEGVFKNQLARIHVLAQGVKTEL
ncbi:Myeloid-derived growth factor [Holothuria leucospilota]|uniref:Myeloid-derived growth factor n=1 Tax=Holothuria leucospilota TaxID=206669 RepID=A0A9Q1BN76_HOLLE|nr:Myeloid-derived growth factor [Holothuria leucospilota]